MNTAVACYMLLLVSSIALLFVSLQKYHTCLYCGVPRNYKPFMLSAFIAAGWIVVSCNGIWVKWHSYGAKLTVDTPQLVLLIVATLFCLAYSLNSSARIRSYK